MWTSRSPYCHRFMDGPWGRWLKGPKLGGSSLPFGRGSLSSTWISIWEQCNNWLLFFFFSSHHFNVLRMQNSFDLESPLRTRANIQPQFEKTFSITARLDQLSFPKSTNPRSMWVRFLVHFFTRNSYVEVGFSPLPSRHWGWNLNLI